MRASSPRVACGCALLFFVPAMGRTMALNDRPAAPVVPSSLQLQPWLQSQQRTEQELQRLKGENAGLQAEVAEANERAEEVQANLLAAGEREQALATLLACAGYDCLSVGPLSWSAPQAQQLLDEEAEELEKLRELDDTIRSGRARVQGLLSAQLALQQQLGASLVAAS